MMMKFNEEFKQAIRELDDKEKDKLLLRLLKKDRILAERLQFELLGYESREQRRKSIEDQILHRLQHSSFNFSMDGLQKELRNLTKSINEHVKITTDKVGEVYLDLILMNETLRLNNKRMQGSWWTRTDKLHVYLVNRFLKILVQLRALHEDYAADFREDLERLGHQILENDSLFLKAKRMGMESGWLTDEVPEDIKTIVAELKKAGRLKG